MSKPTITVEQLGAAIGRAIKGTMSNPSRTRCCVEVRDAETGDVLRDPQEHQKNYKPLEQRLTEELDQLVEPT